MLTGNIAEFRPQRARFLGSGASHTRETGGTSDFAEFVSVLGEQLIRQTWVLQREGET